MSSSSDGAHAAYDPRSTQAPLFLTGSIMNVTILFSHAITPAAAQAESPMIEAVQQSLTDALRRRVDRQGSHRAMLTARAETRQDIDHHIMPVLERAGATNRVVVYVPGLDELILPGDVTCSITH